MMFSSGSHGFRLSVAVLLVSCVDAAKRVKLTPFTISMQPIYSQLSTSQAVQAQYEVEEILADFLEDYSWPEGTEVSYVGVARILENGYAPDSFQASLTMDGLVYFTDSSPFVPSEAEMYEIVLEALTPEVLLTELQDLFPGIESSSVETDSTDTPTAAPSVSLTDSPTSPPTSTPTASPTSHPTSLPTTTPTTSPTTSPTGLPTTGPTGNPTLSPTSSPTGGPTTLPTSSPTIVGTQPPSLKDTPDLPTFIPTILPSVMPTLSPTQSKGTVSGAIGGLPGSSSSPDASNIPAIAGSVAAVLAVLLAASILFIQRHRKSFQVTTQDILLFEESKHGAGGSVGSPTKTINSSMLEDDPAAPPSQEQPSMQILSKLPASQDFTAADKKQESSSDICSSLDFNVDDIHLDLEWDNSSDWQSSPGLRPVESFEQQRHVQYVKSLKKDMLQSPGLSTMNFTNSAGTRGSPDDQRRYHCALKPTEVTAASLAMASRDEDEGDRSESSEDIEKIPSTMGATQYTMATEKLSGLLPQISNWWGGGQSPGRHFSEDESTLGNDVKSDWDPDDSGDLEGVHGVADLFDARVEDKDKQTSLNHSLKNESFKMQRLRSPNASQPYPVRHVSSHDDSSDDGYSSSVFVL